MRAAILSLIAVALAASLAELLLPGDEGKGTKRFLKMLVSLAVLLLLLRPFLGFLDAADGFFDGEVGEIPVTETDYGNLLGDAVAKRSKQDIEKEDAKVTVTLEKDGTLRRVSVILSGKALLTDPDSIEARLVDLLNCEVEVR